MKDGGVGMWVYAYCVLKPLEYECIIQMLENASFVVNSMSDADDLRLKLQLDNLKVYTQSLLADSKKVEVLIS